VLGAGLPSAVDFAANLTVSLTDGNLNAATLDDASIYGLNLVKIVSVAPSARC
jgi:pyruvoyl-dependent arginine decarboxylase (PvlArgDC)